MTHTSVQDHPDNALCICLHVRAEHETYRPSGSRGPCMSKHCKCFKYRPLVTKEELRKLEQAGMR